MTSAIYYNASKYNGEMRTMNNNKLSQFKRQKYERELARPLLITILTTLIFIAYFLFCVSFTCVVGFYLFLGNLYSGGALTGYFILLVLFPIVTLACIFPNIGERIIGFELPEVVRYILPPVYFLFIYVAMF